MRIGKLIGWMFLAGAFAFAAAETAAQGIARQHGLISAYTVLHTLIPGELIQTRIIIQKNIHPALWDNIILAILWFPGWLSLGLPGIFLSWKYRNIPVGGDEVDEDFVNSSYDDILAAAEEFDEHIDDPADLSPSKYGHLDDFNPAADHASEETADQGPENEMGEFKLEKEHLAEPKKPKD